MLASKKNSEAMTDRPLLMSGPMVRATLAELKTNTRRLLKLEGVKAVKHHGGSIWSFTPEVLDAPMKTLHPRYAVGDRLWVRENWALELQETDGAPVEPRKVLYAATDSWDGPSLPSIHMRRTDSRLTLVVTGVKVERLQDISDDDCIAEGVKASPAPYDFDVPGVTNGRYSIPQDAFKALWNGLNAKRAPWDSNPWVVAIAYKAHKCNIDRMP